MFEKHTALHARINAILGEEVVGHTRITKAKIYDKRVRAEVWMSFPKSPRNFQKKHKNSLRFILSFIPETVIIQPKISESMDRLHYIDSQSLIFDMGDYQYQFKSAEINFNIFEAFEEREYSPELPQSAL